MLRSYLKYSVVYCNSSEIYNLLLKDNLTKGRGEIIVDFLNISIKINQKSVIGDLFQEWFAAWLTSKEIIFRTKSNTQEFPDFLLDAASDKLNLLEIKVFDFDRSANFDIANFEAYCRSLKTQAYRLDTDYLIFAYQLHNNRFSIQEFWVKKIWEIAGNSEQYPIKCQVKQNVIVNIRPISWYSKKSKFKSFSCRREFVEALFQTLKQYPKTKENSHDWLDIIKNNYLEHTGKEL